MLTKESRNHERAHLWLHFIEVVIIGIASLALATVADRWLKSSAEKAVEEMQLQTRNQLRTTDMQDRSSQAELAARVLPYMKCDNLWPMTYHILANGAPNYAVDAGNFHSECLLKPVERLQVAKLRTDAELGEIRINFLKHLAAAREYHHVALESDAATEYAQAYNAMPSEYSRLVDHGAAENGRLALKNGQFREAVDNFASAFAKIPTP